jgi:hypothetical protein
VIPLSGGKEVALVDPEDYDELAKYSWNVWKRDDHVSVYAWRGVRVNGKFRTIYMHSQITGWDYVDHKDTNGLNNRRSNLRKSTVSQNRYNMHKYRGNHSSRYKGVSLVKSTGRWRAYINIAGSRIVIGTFDTEEEAAQAYNAKAREYHGVFARLNEIGEKRWPSVSDHNE